MNREVYVEDGDLDLKLLATAVSGGHISVENEDGEPDECCGVICNAIIDWRNT